MVRAANENIHTLHERVRQQAGQAAANEDELREGKLKLAALEREAAPHSEKERMMTDEYRRLLGLYEFKHNELEAFRHNVHIWTCPECPTKQK